MGGDISGNWRLRRGVRRRPCYQKLLKNMLRVYGQKTFLCPKLCLTVPEFQFTPFHFSNKGKECDESELKA